MGNIISVDFHRNGLPGIEHKDGASVFPAPRDRHGRHPEIRQMNDVPLIEAYYAYCGNYDHNADHPQVGRVVVGTLDQIERELNRPQKQRMPSWNGLCAGLGDVATSEQRELLMYANFIALIVRDGIDPKTAHEAFLVVPEYRRYLAVDVPGVAEYEDYPSVTVDQQ